MGDKPDPYEPGESCGNCWGEGKPFGDFPPPKTVTVTFGGIEGPPELPPFPNGVPFACEQQELAPCIWKGEFPEMTPDGFTLFVQWGVGSPITTQLVAWGGFIGSPYFLDSVFEACVVNFTNERLHPPNAYGNGAGHVT